MACHEQAKRVDGTEWRWRSNGGERGIGEASPHRCAIILRMPHLAALVETSHPSFRLCRIVCWAAPNGGERGIRTPGTFRLNSFQDYRIRPLCHLSSPSSGKGLSKRDAFDCKMNLKKGDREFFHSRGLRLQ